MYYLTTIQNLKIIKSYKTYRGAEKAHNNLLKKGTIQEGRKLFFGACILLDSRYNELNNKSFLSLSNNLKNTIKKIANGSPR